MGNPLTMTGVILIVIISSLLGLAWALWNFLEIRKIKIEQQNSHDHQNGVSEKQKYLLLDIGFKISDGSYQFLKQQFLICIIFTVIMFFIILAAIQRFNSAYISLAYLAGSFVSILCSTLGMLIATSTNFRVAYESKHSLKNAFTTAYHGGLAIGFTILSIGILILMLLILIYQSMMGLGNVSGSASKYYTRLFQSIIGFGLGTCTVSLFGRVGGGIYAKGADIGADLIGKFQPQLQEDSPKNPATIADYVGDNVGKIVGMSSDLLGSLIQCICATLLISSSTLFEFFNNKTLQVISIQNLMYPFVLISFGILLSILTSSITLFCNQIREDTKLQNIFTYQSLIITTLLLGFIYLAAWLSFPSRFVFNQISNKSLQIWVPYVCTILGLICEIIIDIFTKILTSNSFAPVRGLAEASTISVPTNIIYGIFLGQFSTLVPVICITLTVYGSYQLMGYYGICLSALGMLSKLPISLSVYSYGPITDNSGGIVQMAFLGDQAKQRSILLDEAKIATSTIIKNYSITCASLVTLSIFGGFLYINNFISPNVDLITFKQPSLFIGLLIGGMIPYAFSALILKSVGKIALGIFESIKFQIMDNPGILTGNIPPDYQTCIKYASIASLVEIILPGCLIIIVPLLFGIAFGSKSLVGFLLGSLVSAIQIAISSVISGGAWANTKTYVQTGSMIEQYGQIAKKGGDTYNAASIGDSIGDPLKDASGPGLNIVMKLMTVISIIFSPLFLAIHPL